MTVRDLLPEDIPELERIHEQQGLDYQFPDLESPLFLVKKVFCRGDKVVAGLVLKVCAETMLLLDGEQGPQDKLTEMQMLQSSVLSEAYQKGLDEIYAAIPEIGFDKRLVRLGWQKDRPGWHLWTRSTHDA